MTHWLSSLAAGILIVTTCAAQGAETMVSVVGRDSSGRRKARSSVPWWDQQKIRWGWGQWGRTFAGSGLSQDEVFRNLARVGLTVFMDNTNDIEKAPLARKYGIRYFKQSSIHELPQFAEDAPPAVDKEGKEVHNCPRYRPLYKKWFLDRALEAAKTGLVDGFHLAWEAYYGWGVQVVCYCDDCFGTFVKGRGLDTVLSPAERYPWLVKQKLDDDYRLFMQDERAAMFRDFAREIREVKPDFLFSSYGPFDANDTDHDAWVGYGAALGLSGPDTPFLIIDSCHYHDDNRRPWWHSLHAYHRELGFRNIAGTWDNSVFGGQPYSDLSAAEWMYEAAINRDGCWLWHEQELGPDVWRALAIADRRIRATEQKVGDFLLQGKHDIHFVTPVEWSGNPDLERKIIQKTYHLDRRHLVHINNVETNRGVRLRLRFPRLPRGRKWLVQDPISGFYYSPDDGSALWSREQLLAGVTVALAKRSELFLLLTPARREPRPEPSRLLAPLDISTMPMPPRREGAVPAAGATAGPDRLLYLSTELLGFDGAIAWTMGNTICAVDADGTNEKRLRRVKGYLWSPSWSPDGTRVAFTHYAEARGQVFVMNADGTGAVNLSSNEYCDKTPAWSPDGTRIAFASDRDADWEIYVMNTDGSGQTRLTESPGLDRIPRWSPDGGRILFESERGGRETDICVMNTDGTDARTAIEWIGNAEEAVWSPDGSRIAAVGIYSWCRLLVKDVGSDDRARTVMTQPYIGSIRWSPDGKTIAGTFRGPQETDMAGVFTIDANGGSPRYLAHVTSVRPHTGGGRTRKPCWYSTGGGSPRWVVKTFSGVSWSPDGERIAFSSDMGDAGDFYVYTVLATGGQIPQGRDIVEVPEMWLFRKDPGNVGKREKWFAPGAKSEEWQPISTHAFWDQAIGKHESIGWYAVDLTFPAAEKREEDFAVGLTGKAAARDRKIWMVFGGVDENYSLWINGEYIGDNLADGTTMWDKPVAVDITGMYNPGQSNHVVVRVKNTVLAGGIWQPVRIIVEEVAGRPIRLDATRSVWPQETMWSPE